MGRRAGILAKWDPKWAEMRAASFAINQPITVKICLLYWRGIPEILYERLRGNYLGEGPSVIFWRTSSVTVKKAYSRTLRGFEDEVMKRHIGLRSGSLLQIQLLFGRILLPPAG